MKRGPGRPFLPGQSGNPRGMPALPPELRKERKENRNSLIRLMSTYAKMTHEQALARLSGPGALQIEEMVQGLINKAREGDVNAFKFLMETMVGKIPDDNDEAFSEEDLRILKRVKELREEEKKPEAAG